MLGWLSRGPPACFPQPVALQCDHRDRVSHERPLRRCLADPM